jgi:hypothetical protein
MSALGRKQTNALSYTPYSMWQLYRLLSKRFQELSKIAKQEPIWVGRERVDAAVELLLSYSPEQHQPRDYVLTIASSILGRSLQRRDGYIWSDEGERLHAT